jgi:hypothetical protein
MSSLGFKAVRFSHTPVQNSFTLHITQADSSLQVFRYEDDDVSTLISMSRNPAGIGDNETRFHRVRKSANALCRFRSVVFQVVANESILPEPQFTSKNPRQPFLL